MFSEEEEKKRISDTGTNEETGQNDMILKLSTKTEETPHKTTLTSSHRREQLRCNNNNYILLYYTYVLMMDNWKYLRRRHGTELTHLS